jgi:hypothetical protein
MKYANQAADAQGQQQAQYDAAYQEGVAAAQAAAPPPAAAPAAPAGGIQDQIMQLANLHAQGILTDEEFAAAMQKVISGG